MFKSRCLAGAFLFGLIMGTGASAETFTDNTFIKTLVSGVTLQGTTTLVLSAGDNTSAAGGGEAFFCEGDPPTNYHCSNSYASYGCSEDCQCCYYEEKFVREDDEAFGLADRR